MAFAAAIELFIAAMCSGVIPALHGMFWSYLMMARVEP